ncbi:DNA repair protein RadA [Pelagibaculum spongiae]|uniref:DNA repair protein RadA n=1 Tax=Pelagibaculum spongiae TaxID=2080658 RepID=A0A2V1GV99_9GAMM|nr:DNA repair protein RadA [Pelagibaculum spongiae]PVZ70258.1 DNA repair protein RadA [Pelagibaculum spongiae]
MAKEKIRFVCSECGADSPKWAGRCNDCGAWNSMQEQLVSNAPAVSKNPRSAGWTGTAQTEAVLINEVNLVEDPRFSSGLLELDRVLGGGMVDGAVVLIGGDPGIGKSTLLIQSMAHLSTKMPVLYVTGEESLQQVALRARRLGLPTDKLKLLTETRVEKIAEVAEREKPKVMVVDSIQTIFSDLVSSAPGSVSQVRESAARLVRLAKQSGVAIFLVGHVTKDGSIAGPRVLEHMVDTVLYFEGDKGSRFRAIRAIKNRFGAVNELGVFAMTDRGLKEVSNPSAIFLSGRKTDLPGSAVMVSWEGTRPLLVEVQALVDDSHTGHPRRVAVGLDHNRLAMLLAVLHRHGGIATHDQDVFLNVVGGVKVLETGIDLAVLLAVISGLRSRPLPEGLVVFGEIGLSGEIRPVPSGQERIKDAAKHGFTRAIVPKGNAPRTPIDGMEVVAVEHLSEAVDAL